MYVHARSDQKSTTGNVLPTLKAVLVAVFALLIPQASSGSESNSPKQLLQSFYDTAGVCTTSSIESIAENRHDLTVHINIEKTTAKALIGVSGSRKDDWFSLHCPPEIHGIWKVHEPSHDVLISGLLGQSEHHTLSCLNYLKRDQIREQTFRQRIRTALERMLSGH